jgi:hypothetical protein
MIEFKVDPRSITNTVDYLEAVRKRIFEGVRSAMEEGIEELGEVAKAGMSAAGIQSRTGALMESLEWHSVEESATKIYSSIRPVTPAKVEGRDVPTFYLATALDEGFHVKAVEGKTFQFTKADGGTLFSRGHVAFDVKPRPFLRQSVQSFAPVLLDLIQARVNEAVQGLT